MMILLVVISCKKVSHGMKRWDSEMGQNQSQPSKRKVMESAAKPLSLRVRSASNPDLVYFQWESRLEIRVAWSLPSLPIVPLQIT